MNRKSIGLVLLGMFLGVVAVAGVLVAAFFFMRPKLEDMLPPPRFPERTTLSETWQLVSLAGKPVEIKPGHEVLFISFWATWCGPCVAEMPSIQNLYEQMKGQNLIVACISDEELESVREFVSRKKWTVPVYVKGKSDLPLEPDGYPTTIIIDREGMVVYQDTGAARWDSPEAIAFFKKLLAATPNEQKATK